MSDNESAEPIGSAWISCECRPPIGEDYGSFFHSVDVLFTNGNAQWVGYLQTWENEEYKPTWKMKGPDGWDVEHVTHWMPLPSLPNAVAVPRHGSDVGTSPLLGQKSEEA